MMAIDKCRVFASVVKGTCQILTTAHLEVPAVCSREVIRVQHHSTQAWEKDERE